MRLQKHPQLDRELIVPGYQRPEILIPWNDIALPPPRGRRTLEEVSDLLCTLDLTGRTTCTGFPSTHPHEMEVAVTFAKTAVKLAGDICGVPGTPILADAIVTLIETCESIPRQKYVHRTHALLASQLTHYLGRTSKIYGSGV